MSEENRQSSRLIFRPRAKATPKIEPRLSDDERLAAAREKAADYRNPPPPTPSPHDKAVRKTLATDDPETKLDEWADLVSKRIEEAMRRGDFDNLRGQGQPLRVAPEPFVPEDQQMAFKLLKNNEMTPAWIGERKEMLRAIETWRGQFQHVVGEAHRAWIAAASDERRIQVRESWARWLVRWDAELVELNRRIGLFNLKQPITHLEIFKLRLDDELRKLGMARTLER